MNGSGVCFLNGAAVFGQRAEGLQVKSQGQLQITISEYTSSDEGISSGSAQVQASSQGKGSYMVCHDLAIAC